MNVPPTTLEAIIQETLRRRAGGEQLEDDVVIAAHPALMPQLEMELKKLRLIAGARAEAGAATAEFGDTVIHSQEMSQEDTDSPLAEDRRPGSRYPTMSCSNSWDVADSAKSIWGGTGSTASFQP
jgi:hypothetical protein